MSIKQSFIHHRRDMPVSKWIARCWPYVLIAIALAGLAYRIWTGQF